MTDKSSLAYGENTVRLQTYDCFIHSFQGSLDKTIVEATFLGLPVITINNEYRNIFGSWNLTNKGMNNSLKDEAQLLLNLENRQTHQ